MPATSDGDSSKTVSDDKKPSGAEDNSSRKRWVKRPAVWVGALATAVITGVLVNLVTGAVSDASHGGASPNIEVDSVTAQYVPQARPIRLDFEIRNTGNQLAIIKAATITIQQFAALQVCFSQGGLFSTGTYNASLPIDPLPGQSVNIPTAQQLAPDAADRFDITLGLPAVKLPPDVIYVYRISIGLLYDNSPVPADAGEAVVALPVAPYEGYFWTKQFAAHPTSIPGVALPFNPSASSVSRVNRCLVGNSRKLHSILALVGVRPPELSAIQSQLSTCCGWTLPAVKPNGSTE